MQPGKEARPEADADAERQGGPVRVDATTIPVRTVHLDVAAGIALGQDGKLSASSVLPRQGVAKYVVGEAVARGGMGEIRTAKDLNVRRGVAMKVMRPSKRGDPGSMLRFVAEAQVTGQLEHPGIVPVYELGVDAEGNAFYTMKYVQGRTLREVLKGIAAGDRGLLTEYPLSHLLTVFLKVCDAVAFAHAKGVLHRDLKPANIMIGAFGEVQVMDWGLAKILGEEGPEDWPDGGTDPAQELVIEEPAGSSQTPGSQSAADTGTGTAQPGVGSVRRDGEHEAAVTVDGQVLGTPSFMAPEQALGRVNQLDARTDIYALGAILYDILTLRPPVEGASMREVVYKAATGEITPPVELSMAGSTSSGPRPSRRKVRSAAELGRAAQAAARTRQSVETAGGPFPHCPGGRIPPALSAVAMRALSRNPSGRYPTVKDLQAEIEAYQSGFVTSAEQAGVARQLMLLVRRRWTEFLLGVAALIALIAVTTVFVANLHREKSRANTALGDLRRVTGLAAPRFLESARRHMGSGDWATAIAETDLAIGLDPSSSDAWHLKGRLHLGEQQFTAAAVAFRNAGRPASLKLAELAETYGETATQNGGKLPGFHRLSLVTLLEEQGEQIVTARLLQGRGSVGLRLDLKARAAVEALRGANPGLEDMEAGFEISGQKLHLWLRECESLRDITALKGLPLELLHLSRCRVDDLSALRDMPLSNLSLNGAPVADITPLKGMKLSQLTLKDTKVEDISVLASMPLRGLHVAGSPVSEISALAGMPLDTLNLGQTEVSDLTPLRGVAVTWLLLDDTAVTDLSPLRDAPLRWLSFGSTGASDLSPLAGMPLTNLHFTSTQVADITPLRGMPLRELRMSESLVRDLSPLAGAPLTFLSMEGIPADDISALRGAPLTSLFLSRTRVSDLSPLEGAPVSELGTHGSRVSDLSVLPTLPLKGLFLGTTSCRDLTPLADCRQLEKLGLDGPRQDMDFLRVHPALKTIQYTNDLSSWSSVTKPAAEFWAEYDRAKSATAPRQ